MTTPKRKDSGSGYGIGRDDVSYIMDTFPIVRKNDEEAHGEYRTKRLILEKYDAMAAGAYQTPLDPPPGDIRAAHGPGCPCGHCGPGGSVRPKSRWVLGIDCSKLTQIEIDALRIEAERLIVPGLRPGWADMSAAKELVLRRLNPEPEAPEEERGPQQHDLF